MHTLSVPPITEAIRDDFRALAVVLARPSGLCESCLRAPAVLVVRPAGYPFRVCVRCGLPDLSPVEAADLGADLDRTADPDRTHAGPPADPDRTYPGPVRFRPRWRTADAAGPDVLPSQRPLPGLDVRADVTPDADPDPGPDHGPDPDRTATPDVRPGVPDLEWPDAPAELRGQVLGSVAGLPQLPADAPADELADVPGVTSGPCAGPAVFAARCGRPVRFLVVGSGVSRVCRHHLAWAVAWSLPVPGETSWPASVLVERAR